MKYFKTFILLSILGIFYSSCVKKANYPYTPVITYNSFIPFGSGIETDSAFLRVNFTDGNGDIGYPQQQEGVPHDFFVEPLIYNANTNTYDSIVYDGSATTILTYNIPYITPKDSDKELNGIIQINFEDNIYKYISLPWAPYLSQGYIYYNVRFKVWLYDRAGNKSNVLLTPAVCTTCFN